MSLYPSLEDMKFDQLTQAQIKANNAIAASNEVSKNNVAPANNQFALYPALGDYMGLEISEEILAANMPEYSAVALRQTYDLTPPSYNQMIAPISGQSVGLHRAQVTNGIRELILCKDKDDKIGLRVKSVNNGVFVCLVVKNSAAALVGLRFGDQILQINNEDVAGFSMEKVHDLLRKCPINGISIIVRDRPFERTVTLHKDSTSHLGFHFKNGKIVNLVKDSSAARNGLLTEHQLLEVNGQNVIAMKDKDITKIINDGGDVVTITIIPSIIYDHMVKKMATSLIKDLMDHTMASV